MPIISINFYGLTRNSLHITLPSIKRNILTPLREAGIQYEIYLHTYDLKVLSMKRSGESDIILKPDEWKLLKPNYWKITSQEEFDKSFDYERIKKFGDSWGTNFQNTYGLIRQLNSIKTVKSLWNKTYDFYLFLRPDLFYNDKIDIKFLSLKQTIILPNWHSSGGYNDRFAFGTLDVINLWGNRFDEIFNYCEISRKPLHAERLLKYVCTKNRLSVYKTGMRASRVRANGSIIDFGYVYSTAIVPPIKPGIKKLKIKLRK